MLSFVRTVIAATTIRPAAFINARTCALDTMRRVASSRATSACTSSKGREPVALISAPTTTSRTSASASRGHSPAAGRDAAVAAAAAPASTRRRKRAEEDEVATTAAPAARSTKAKKQRTGASAKKGGPAKSSAKKAAPLPAVEVAQMAPKSPRSLPKRLITPEEVAAAASRSKAYKAATSKKKGATAATPKAAAAAAASSSAFASAAPAASSSSAAAAAGASAAADAGSFVFKHGTLTRDFERNLLVERGLDPDTAILFGVDEAGRGPLAGPVVCAAAYVPSTVHIAGVHDSKLMSEAERETVFAALTTHPDVKYSVRILEHDEIDRINILEATMRGMTGAAQDLSLQLSALTPAPLKASLVLIDGNRVPKELQGPSTMFVIKGDSLSYSIAAASVIAKVTRDRIMLAHHHSYPQWNFAQHKGYGVAAHMSAIYKHGPSPIHRMTFAPMKHMKVLSAEEKAAKEQKRAREEKEQEEEAARIAVGGGRRSRSAKGTKQ